MTKTGIYKLTGRDYGFYIGQTDKEFTTGLKSIKII